MVASRLRAFGICLSLVLGWATASSAQTAPDGVTPLLRRLQQAAGAGDRAAILALGAPQISRPSFSRISRPA